MSESTFDSVCVCVCVPVVRVGVEESNMEFVKFWSCESVNMRHRGYSVVAAALVAAVSQVSRVLGAGGLWRRRSGVGYGVETAWTCRFKCWQA